MTANETKWRAAVRPFRMLPQAANWRFTKGIPLHDRRCRHLAAAALWYAVSDPESLRAAGRQLDARVVAAVLDRDPPGSPAAWSGLVRLWLRNAVPEYRNRPDPGPDEQSLGAVIAHLHRSRRDGGLRSVVEWSILSFINESEFQGHESAADTYRRRHRTTGPQALWDHESPHLAGLIRDVYPRPDGPVRGVWADRFDLQQFDSNVVALARQIWTSRDYTAMPILADALQDAGCEKAEVLDHCRDPAQPHCRGCWVLETILWNEQGLSDTGGLRVHSGLNGAREALIRVVPVVGFPDLLFATWRRASETTPQTTGYFRRAELSARFPGWDQPGEFQ